MPVSKGEPTLGRGGRRRLYPSLSLPFDRHRDLTLPTSFLIDEAGFIVKIYQGAINKASHLAEDLRNIPTTPAQRLAKALPFPVVRDGTEFRRNYLACGSVFFSVDTMSNHADFFRIAPERRAE